MPESTCGQRGDISSATGVQLFYCCIQQSNPNIRPSQRLICGCASVALRGQFRLQSKLVGSDLLAISVLSSIGHMLSAQIQPLIMLWWLVNNWPSFGLDLIDSHFFSRIRILRALSETTNG